MTLDPLRLPLSGWQLIEASAGTGKTWTLAALYLRLVLGEAGRPGLLPPQILVMTFTEAATAELRGRIRARLAEAAQVFAGQAEGDALVQALKAQWSATDWPACAWRLDQAAQWMDDAAIHTIHGWSSRMLREHALDSRSLFEQSVVEDGQALQQAAVRDWWRRWLYPLAPAPLGAALQALGREPDALLARLLPLWADAARQPQPPIPEPAHPHQVLADWSRWQTQLQALEAQARALWMAQLPAVLALLDVAMAQDLNGTSYPARHRARYLDELAAWAQGQAPADAGLLRRFALSTLQQKTKKGRSAPTDLGGAFSALDAWCAHQEAAPDLATTLTQHAAYEVGQAYAQAKARRAQFDFADLLQQLYHAVMAPDGRLAQAIRRQYPVALVDEFQDTDPWQWGSLARIYGPETPDADANTGQVPATTALILIGDPKQAIYSFRGADLGTYLAAREATLARDAQALHTLSGNFRSTAGGVAAVNRVFTQAQAPFGSLPYVPVSAQNPRVLPLRRADGQWQAALTAWVLTADAPLNKTSYQQQMAECMASQMVALLNEGVAQPGDMAVLVRSAPEARVLRAALAARQVPSVYLSDRSDVFQSAEALDLWRLLRAWAQPRDAGLLRAALATRLWGLSWSALEALTQDEAAWDAMTEKVHRWHRCWQRQGLLPALYLWQHEEGVARRLLAGPEGERRLTNLLHLGELLQAASQQLQGEGALVRHLAAQMQARGRDAGAAQMRLESDASRVQVVTYHKSKGLQYPLVFLPFVSNFKRPGADDEDDGAESSVAEDLRLLYVALTRAERALWLGLAETRGDMDGSGATAPSRFSAVSQLLGRRARGDLWACLQAAWGGQADIAISAAPPAQTQFYQPPPASLAFQPARVPERSLHQTWWTASFSALTRGLLPLAAEDEPLRPDADPAPVAEPLPTGFDEKSAPGQHSGVIVGYQNESDFPESTEATAAEAAEGVSVPELPAGAAFGTLLHDLLEWQAQQGWPGGDAPGWLALVARQARLQNLSDAQAAQLSPWLVHWLQQPLALPGAQQPLRLSALAAGDFWAEMAFTLPSQALSSAQLDRWMRRWLAPGQARPALAPQQLGGMLMGFMDLVLLHEGRYWVLDYKSNRLPSYDRAALQASVLGHRYELQYSLYVLALHRLLSARLPGYDYDQHVGGAVYLYLRAQGLPGSAADAQAGVWVDRPPRVLIETLDAALRSAPTPGADFSEAS